MKKSGFTLIEVLASLAIISLLVLVGSQIFGQSLRISRKSYQDELMHKEAAYAMAYLDNNIRSAYKIELLDKETNVSNIKTYSRNRDGSEISSYIFDLKEENGNIYLKSETNNITKNSDGTGQIIIARVDSARVFYDPISETVHIIINENSEKFRYESIINMGHRL